MYQKAANFDEWKLIFWKKILRFFFVEHALFPNVGFLSTFGIIKGVFSKYFSKFCRICLKDQEYNVANKTWTFLFSFILQKSPRNFLSN